MNPGPKERFLNESQALACVHCGLCLNSCPTYLETGNENNSPRGRIYLMRALQDGKLEVTRESVKPLDLCLGCRACEVACPSGVQYGDLLEQTRDHIEGTLQRGWFQRILRRVLIERVFPVPGRMRVFTAPAFLVKRLKLDRLMPKFIRESLELIPEAPSAGNLPEQSQAIGPTVGEAGFVSGCVMQALFQDTNRASIKLLNHSGFNVSAPRGQVCCGALFAHSGRLEQARECARTNIAVFEKLNANIIVINAAGCGSTLKEYGRLLEHDPEWAERGEQFSRKVKDLTEVVGAAVEKCAPAPPQKVTYHDACHLAHAQRIVAEPRNLLRRLANVEFVELPESDLCCGSAGSYNLTEPEMAGRLQTRKTTNILKTGATLVVTTNPGCLLQIQAGLRAAGATGVAAMHIADFLVKRLDPDSKTSVPIRKAPDERSRLVENNRQ